MVGQLLQFKKKSSPMIHEPILPTTGAQEKGLLNRKGKKRPTPGRSRDDLQDDKARGAS